MPRPKGSKNRKELIVADSALGDLIAKFTEDKAALETELDELAAVMAEQAAKMKAIKAEIKKLNKELLQLNEQKAAAEAAAKEAAAREAVQNKVNQLMAEGKSLDDIMNMLG